MQETGTTTKRVATGLQEQVKTLMLTSAMAMVFTVIMMASVDRDELKEADTRACIGARPNRCERSSPWKWGNTQSFGVVWSYRLLSSSVISIMFFAFTLFFTVALLMSLCVGMNREFKDTTTGAMKLWFWLHDIFSFVAVACFFIGLCYFLFAVQALAHIKYVSTDDKN